MKSSAQTKQDGLQPSSVSDSTESSLSEHVSESRRVLTTSALNLHIESDPKRSPVDAIALGLDTTVISGDTARMLKTLLGNLEGMVYRCRDDDKWTMEFISEGCRRLTGYDADDLLLNNRVSYESLTHPDDRRRVREDIHNALVLRNRFDSEYRIVHANGEIRWVWERGTGVLNEQGELVAIEGLIQDITERKQSHQALREAERRYYNLFENAIEGIFRTTLEGEFIDANPALARIYGFESPIELMRSLKDIRNQL
ncbi:MAG TPA: PAS domain-containing protein, partial [Steroidobacteraceae bacterium]|nr:PAS domain-containing protein [Steroidobacteraceae bacterium]